MSLSKEKQEYHLTENGWIEGSFYGDAVGGKITRPIPEDRVLTIQCIDKTTSIYSKTHFYDQIIWETNDKNKLSELKHKFGKKPDWFGYRHDQQG